MIKALLKIDLNNFKKSEIKTYVIFYPRRSKNDFIIIFHEVII